MSFKAFLYIENKYIHIYIYIYLTLRVISFDILFSRVFTLDILPEYKLID